MSVDERSFCPGLRTMGTAGANPTTIYTPHSDDVRGGVSPACARIAAPVGDGLVELVMHVVGA